MSLTFFGIASYLSKKKKKVNLNENKPHIYILLCSFLFLSHHSLISRSPKTWNFHTKIAWKGPLNQGTMCILQTFHIPNLRVFCFFNVWIMGKQMTQILVWFITEKGQISWPYILCPLVLTNCVRERRGHSCGDKVTRDKRKRLGYISLCSTIMVNRYFIYLFFSNQGR